jgi:hypothetical protein
MKRGGIPAGVEAAPGEQQEVSNVDLHALCYYRVIHKSSANKFNSHSGRNAVAVRLLIRTKTSHAEAPRCSRRLDSRRPR